MNTFLPQPKWADMFRSEICPICGKEFVVAPYHAYEIHGRHSRRYRVCSWHCVMAYEKKHPDKQEIRHRRIIELELQGLLPIKGERRKHVNTETNNNI